MLNLEIASMFADALRGMLPDANVIIDGVPGRRGQYVLSASIRRKGQTHGVVIETVEEMGLLLAALEMQSERAGRPVKAEFAREKIEVWDESA